MRNRYYDPRTGRFTQEDPIGLAGGLNLYGFADGDPVNFSDPFGLNPLIIARLAVWVLGTAAPFLSRVATSLTGLSGGPPPQAVNPRAAATLGRLAATLEGNISKFDDMHIDAAARELAGEVVARKASGTPFNHVTEFENAVQGVRNVVSGLNRLLTNGRPTPEQRQVAEVLRQRAIDELRRAQEALKAAQAALRADKSQP